jgi:hypothetical protein
VGVIVDTAPQMIFWAAALFFAVLAAYRSLTGRRKALASPPPELAEVSHTRSPGGQVAYWALRVQVMRQSPSPYFTSSFHQMVTRLLMDALSHRYRLTIRQVEDGLRDGTLDVPAEVRDYALNGLRRFDTENRPFFADLWARITQALNDLLRPNRPQNSPQDDRNMPGADARNRRISADEQMVLVVVNYLEKELEVSNDDTGH